jgi:hypothetical protein
MRPQASPRRDSRAWGAEPIAEIASTADERSTLAIIEEMDVLVALANNPETAAHADEPRRSRRPV